MWIEKDKIKVKKIRLKKSIKNSLIIFMVIFCSEPLLFKLGLGLTVYNVERSWLEVLDRWPQFLLMAITIAIIIFFRGIFAKPEFWLCLSCNKTFNKSALNECSCGKMLVSLEEYTWIDENNEKGDTGRS